MARNPADYPILETMRSRWSPYRFEPKSVEPEKLLQCFEAARWAASSFNDQPWNWIVARREQQEAFSAMIGCLLPANQQWANKAGVLVITAIRKNFQYNDKPNRVALHDLGQAAAHLALQATQLGLEVHQMAGLDLDKTRQVYGIPDTHDPQTAIAIGYPDISQPDDDEPDDDLASELRRRESVPRIRRKLSDQIFGDRWQQTADWV